MMMQVAKYAIDVSPAQAQPWVNLAHVYTANKDFAMALVALNVAPMAHGPEFSMPEMPEPARTSSINEVCRFVGTCSNTLPYYYYMIMTTTYVILMCLIIFTGDS